MVPAPVFLSVVSAVLSVFLAMVPPRVVPLGMMAIAMIAMAAIAGISDACAKR